jgi:MoxR-like ATPase
VPEDVPWRIFRGTGEPHRTPLPPAPPWRSIARRAAGAAGAAGRGRSRPYVIGDAEIDVVNAALHLRRPLLVTGRPGTGKSTLAEAIAAELSLDGVLRWPVNSRSMLVDALYRYDAVGRLRESARSAKSEQPEPDIGTFVRLGPVGTALVPARRPRVLLIDELDKSDLDLPNDLLSVFEDGEFDIPELARLPEDQAEVAVMVTGSRERVTLHRGVVRCTEFPIVVITSNGERDFPAAFLRRCVRLDLPDLDEDRLRDIVTAHLGEDAARRAETEELIHTFLERRTAGELATDQLLNAIHLRLTGVDLGYDELRRSVLRRLDSMVEE